MNSDVFADLPRSEFGCIVADPPWRYSYATGSGGDNGLNADPRWVGDNKHYDTMSFDEIRALPVADLAAGDCVLWLWVVNPMMRDCLTVLDAWGFQWRGMLTWAKTTSDWRTPAFGSGYWLRGASEHAILAVRGKPAKPLRSVPSWFPAPVLDHSRKPEVAFDIFERFSPGPRLELFARRPRHGWTTWGNDPSLGNEPESDLFTAADFGASA